MRLQNKTAIVVGAGQQPGETMGNGRATALRFAQEGARVLCVDISKERAQETVDIIAKEGGAAIAYGVDVTNEDACRDVAEAAQKRFGRIDILHNNVGRSEGDRATCDMDADMWDTLMALNLKSMFLMSKHVLPVMQEQGSGAIINVSSTSSVAARPDRHLQDVERCREHLYPASGMGECAFRHSRQCHTAGTDGYTHGDRAACA